MKRVFRKQGFGSFRGWALVVLMTLTVTGLSAVLGRRLLTWGLPVWIITILSGLLWACVGAVVSLYIWHRPYVRFVRQYLQDHGIMVCLKCGYDLYGLPKPRCPECGLAFQVKPNGL